MLIISKTWSIVAEVKQSLPKRIIYGIMVLYRAVQPIICTCTLVVQRGRTNVPGQNNTFYAKSNKITK